MRPKIVNRSGFTLVETLLASFVLALGFLSLSAISVFITDGQKQFEESTARTLVKAQALSIINNPLSWYQTLEHPSNLPYLSCKINNTDCTGISNKLVLVKQDGTVFYDGNSQGFDDKGSICIGFDASVGNDQCPNKYNIVWDLSCGAGPCTVNSQPQIVVTATLLQSRSSQSKNLSNEMELSFSAVRNLPKLNDFIAYPGTMLTNKGDSNVDLPVRVSRGINTFTLSDIATSAAGGATASGTSLSYTPEASYNGPEIVSFTASTTRLGQTKTAKSFYYVGVMTPYTWVGEANNGDIYDANNWCGTVVNGQCTHNASTASFATAKWIFNELCSNCTVNIGSATTITAIKLESSFNGVINQTADLTVRGANSNFGPALPNCNYFNPAVPGTRYYPARTADDPQLTSLLQVSGGTFNSSAQLRVDYTGTANGCNFSALIDGGQFNSSSLLSVESRYTLIDTARASLTDFQMSGESNSPRLTEFLNGPMQVQNFTWSANALSANYQGGLKGGLIVNGTLTYNPFNTEDGTLASYNKPNGHIYARGDIVLLGRGGGQLTADPTSTDPDIATRQAAMIVLDGAGDQSITGVVNGDLASSANPISCLPRLLIAKPSGTVTFSETVCVSRSFEWQSGSIDASAANLVFGGGMPFSYTTADAMGDLVATNIGIRGNAAFDLFGNMRATSNLYLNRSNSGYNFRHDTATIPVGQKYNKRIAVERDIHVLGGYHEDGFSGTIAAWIEMVGNQNQSIIGGTSGLQWKVADPGTLDARLAGFLPALAINKSGGNVIFQGNVGFGNQLWVRNSPGTIDWSNATLVFTQYNTVGTGQVTIDGAPTMTAVRNLVLGRSLNFNNATFRVSEKLILAEQNSGGGNLNISPTTISNATFQLLDGASLQILDTAVTASKSYRNNNSVNIQFLGNQNQSITLGGGSTAWVARPSSFHILVNKLGGEVVQTSHLNSITSITVNQGVWNQSGFDLSAGTINMSASTTLNRTPASLTGSMGSVDPTATINPPL